jgi:hypothetical protein
MYQHNVGQRRSLTHVQTRGFVGRGVVGRKVGAKLERTRALGQSSRQGVRPVAETREQQRPSHDGALRLETNSEVNVAFLYFRTKLSSQISTVQYNNNNNNITSIAETHRCHRLRSVCVRDAEARLLREAPRCCYSIFQLKLSLHAPSGSVDGICRRRR